MRKTRIAHKFRLYPNKTQKQYIDQCIGYSRFIYNNCLSLQIETYNNHKENEELPSRLNTTQLYQYCTKQLRDQNEWMNLLPAAIINGTIRNLESSYKNFFRNLKKGGKPGFPKFKKRMSAGSFQFQNGKYHPDTSSGYFKLPKSSPIKSVYHRDIEGVMDQQPVYTISRNSAGQYFVSFSTEIEVPETNNSPETPVGLDIGAKDIVITSDGVKYGKLDTIKTLDKRLNKMKSIRDKRMVRGSNNYKKKTLEIAKLQNRINNMIDYHLHKISHDITEQYDLVALEDINLGNMTRRSKSKQDENGNYLRVNRKQKAGLNRSLLKNKLGHLRNILEYKVDHNGGTIVKVDKFYPSSQLCSCCGYKNVVVKDLSNRKYECGNCGVEHDRDINAAVNIMKEGIRLFNSKKI